MYPVLSLLFQTCDLEILYLECTCTRRTITIRNKFALQALKISMGKLPKRKRKSKNPYDLPVKHGDPLNFKM